jgi:hypothetical protein
LIGKERKMRRDIVTSLLCTCLWVTLPVAGGTIKKLDLSMGEEDETNIGVPVFETEGISPVFIGEIAPEYDRTGEIIRKSKSGGMGPKYDLSASVDLGALLGEAMRAEASDMGFRVVEGDTSWAVGGSLRDIFLESHQPAGGWGPIIFWGYVHVELVARRGDESHSFELKLSHLIHRYNPHGIIGRKDEAKEATASLMILSAQEIIAHLNRELWQAKPQPGIAAMIADLGKRGKIEDNDNELLLIGLSASNEAVPVLLELLEKEKDEADRVHIINALANIGSPVAVEPLARRYDNEDTDCQWYIFKAMSFIGNDQAVGFLNQHSFPRKCVECRTLVNWLGPFPQPASAEPED